MIYASMDAKRPAFYPKALNTALDYLASNDITAMEPGEYAIDGDRIFVVVSDSSTEPAEARLPEAHVKYVDIHYVAAGAENIGVSPLVPLLPVEEDELESDDCILYGQAQDEVFITMRPGYFMVLFPQDVHRPLCRHGDIQTVRKAVVKILFSSLLD